MKCAVTGPFLSDGQKSSDKISSKSRTGNAAGHFAESADLFFCKPTGIVVICLLFFGLTVWTFFPVLQTDFQHFDDAAIFLNNSHVNTGLSWGNLRWALFSADYSYSYPLTRISHMLDFEIFGPDPCGHHLTNVLIHAANGVLLFLVLKRMTRRLWSSLLVAGLFALHPLRVESVAWISERKDVLSAFFGLLALWTYACFTDESKAHSNKAKLFYGLTLMLFGFGLMSKSILVTLPCLLLLLDFWPLERWREKDKWNLAIEKVPFFLLVLPVSIFTWIATKGEGQFLLHFPVSFRLETALMCYARYLGKMFWPTNFSVLYPYPDSWPFSQLLIAIVVILGMSVFALSLRRKRPYLLVGWLWFLGTLVPVINLIPLGAQTICNRFTYMPMIGILLLVVWGIDDLSKRWRQRTFILTTFVTMVTAMCMIRTRAEIVYWKDAETLFRRAISVTGKNFMAHYCLAETLLAAKPDEALAEYQESVAIYPDCASAQVGLASALKNKGRVSDALIHLEKAIELEPLSSRAHDGLTFRIGELLLQLNRKNDAIPHLLKAVEIDPQNARFKDVLGTALFSTDHGAEIVSNFLAAVRSDPAGFGSFFEAVQFDTNRVNIINNLAWAFATNPDPKLRNGKYATRLATRACEMTDFQTNYCVGTLAAAYAEDSRFDDAVSTAQLACSLATAATNQPDLLKKNQALLELFRSRQPYHESVKASSY